MIFIEIRSGIFEVRRAEGEPAFALLTSPRHRRDKRWGITYRASPSVEFEGFNVSAKNRYEANKELEHTVKICTDYQLGLIGPTGV